MNNITDNKYMENNDLYKESHQRFKAVEVHLGLKQIEFANKLGFPQSYLSAVSLGRKAVSNNLLRALIKVFHVSPLWMLTGQGPMLLNKGQANPPLEVNPPSEVPSEEFMDALPSLADGEDWQITHWLAIQETAADFRNEYSKAFRRLQTIVGIIEQADWSEAQKLKAIYTICKGGEKLTDSIQLKKP